jgi:hypothetical protein
VEVRALARWSALVLCAALAACEHELLRGGPSTAWLDVAYRGPGIAGADGIAGRYHEAYDCTAADVAGLGEPGHCFRRHGSPWRARRSGCSWELGYNVGAARSAGTWRRIARTHAGPCDALLVARRGTGALTTTTWLDDRGHWIPGLTSVYVRDELALDEVFRRRKDAGCVGSRTGSAAR